MTLTGSDFEKHRKPTRREQFLAEMGRIIPWDKLVAAVEPYYYSGECGCPPVGLKRMLRVYCLELWYNLPDPSLKVEEALYDIEAMRRFAGIDWGRERAPDETTICKFRRLLRRHELGAAIFKVLGELLHGEETRVCGDSAYSGEREQIREAAPGVQDHTPSQEPPSSPAH